MGDNRRDCWVHRPLGGTTYNESNQTVGDKRADSSRQSKKGCSTGILAVKHADGVAMLLQTANLLADKSLHPPEYLGGLRCQNENLPACLAQSVSLLVCSVH